MTDRRRLWDCVTRERVQLTDRRLLLEAAIFRQEAQRCTKKWVKSEQQVADCLTKDATTQYDQVVFESNQWALGPDERAPSKRSRSLPGPDGRVSDHMEANRLLNAARDRKCSPQRGLSMRMTLALPISPKSCALDAVAGWH